MHILLKVCDYELVTPKYNHRPHWYNKLACIRSFMASAENAKSSISGITWIHDGPIGPLYGLIKDQNVVKTNNMGVHGAIYKSNEIANNINDDLCFIDDDYLHLPNSMKVLCNAIKRFGLICGYDNPDRYLLTDDIDYKIQITWDQSSQHHWRTCESACFTYAIRRDIWKKNPWLWIKGNDRETFRKFHSLGIPLWSPIPGVYTHCNDSSRKSSISPGIDWESVSNQYV